MISIFPAYFRDNQPATAYLWLVKLKTLILIIACFLCGPLFGELPDSSYFWQNFGPTFITFLCLFLLWEINLSYLTKFIFSTAFSGSKRLKKLSLIIPALLLSVACFYFLGHFEQKIEEATFFAVVALLGVRAVVQGLFINELLKYMLILIYVYIFSIASLSAFLITNSLNWQFFVLSLSLISGLLSQSLISFILRGQKDQLSISNLYLRLNTFLLFLAPVLILFMVYWGYLDRNYLSVLFSMAPVIISAEKSRTLENFSLHDKYTALLEVEKYACFSSLLFVLTLLVAIFVPI